MLCFTMNIKNWILLTAVKIKKYLPSAQDVHVFVIASLTTPGEVEENPCSHFPEENANVRGIQQQVKQLAYERLKF